MATAYTEYTGTAGTIVAWVKQAILRSSDWSHLQLSTGTQNTTLSSGASPGATSISTAATIPSGSYVVIGNGSANPEVRLTTGVSGSGPYTVTFADALTGTYASSAAVGVGSYVKCTTTRGAQMVLDLADAAPDTQKMQIAAYRTHDGTTAVDKVTRYFQYKWNTGASGQNVYITVSSGKEHLFVKVEGPRAGDSNADNAQYGSSGNTFGICDLVPYFGGDSVAAVILFASVNTGNPDSRTDYLVHVSRNQGNTSSWVPAAIATLQPPDVGTAQQIRQLQSLAKNDGNLYMFPYVVFELADGLRGRASDVFYCGNAQPTTGNDRGSITVGTEITYNSKTYKVIGAFKHRSDGTSNFNNHFGWCTSDTNNSSRYPLIAIPKA